MIHGKFSRNFGVGGSRKRKKIKDLVEQALKEGMSPKDILDKALIPGMAIVGEKFKIGEYFIPEVLVAARAMTCPRSMYHL